MEKLEVGYLSEDRSVFGTRPLPAEVGSGTVEIHEQFIPCEEGDLVCLVARVTDPAGRNRFFPGTCFRAGPEGLQSVRGDFFGDVLRGGAGDIWPIDCVSLSQGSAVAPSAAK